MVLLSQNGGFVFLALGMYKKMYSFSYPFHSFQTGLGFLTTPRNLGDWEACTTGSYLRLLGIIF